MAPTTHTTPCQGTHPPLPPVIQPGLTNMLIAHAHTVPPTHHHVCSQQPVQHVPHGAHHQHTAAATPWSDSSGSRQSI